MGFFLGIDLGTSYFKAGIFDENGKLQGLGRRYVKKEVEDGTHCELPVAVFWDTLHTCIGEALQKAGIIPGEIKAVSYSSQANSFILLDENDNPLTPLILWSDKRAKEVDLADLNFHNEKEFLEKTGLGIAPNAEFAVAKINWFQKKQPELWKRVKSVLSISDYLTFSLTREKVADLSTASLTGLLDVVECRWWDKSLNSFSLSPELLPMLRRTGSIVGPLTISGAKLTGLIPGIFYYSGALDHHCAAIGSGIIQNDKVCESTGTVLSCVGYSWKYSATVNCCVSPGIADGQYFRMAFDDNGALSLEWYQKKFAPELNIPELLEMATEVNKGCAGLVAKPCAYKYQGLEGFDNIKPVHTPAHFVRAILESTAESLAGLLKQVKESKYSGGVVPTGGGAQSRFWVKIKADTLNSPFYIPECSETACLGAAMIGAKGSGELKSWPDLIGRWVRFNEIVTPDFVKPS